MDVKTCSRCNLLLSLDQFPLSKGGLLGRHSRCYQCHRELAAIKRHRNRSETKEIPTKKVCSGCKILLSSACFHKNKTMYDGLDSYCKTCCKIHEGSGLRHDPVEGGVIKCSQCLRNLDFSNFSVNRRNKTGRNTRCKDCVNSYMHSINEKQNDYHHMRRARINTNGTVERIDYNLVFERDQGQCRYCSKDLSNERRKDIHLDHVTPIVLGGEHSYANIVLSCKDCNLRKRGNIWAPRPLG